MRVPDACRYLGIGRSTLYVLIGEGQVEIIKTPDHAKRQLASTVQQRRERAEEALAASVVIELSRRS